ncbi:hemolysin family protein [Schumannella sp. 10F1B-5-1]|uniref:hemolysin family protein n=1 Tax=Schumannella sp. 10F1B-5-1 TaxID=2590780 RepID=UPI001130D0E7|nr:hemolysin family protein [Schumannella sp. 10F1B-5-1]TPW71609.1 HlyC/CorC family transporter [Schumannella sp. 10F1B-5-1]
MSEYLPGILWLVVLLVLNGFFVGAEFAVISAKRSQIEPRAAAGGRAATTTLWAMEHATLMLATSQLGITVCSLVILNVSEPAIHHLLEIPLGFTALSAEAIGVIAFVIALVSVTFLHVVFGEMIPKNLAFSVPDRAALILAPPLVLVSRILYPVIWALNGVANGILRVFRVQPKDEATSAFTLEEVAGIVAVSTREGVLDDRTGALAAAFEFTDKRVSDIEVPTERMRTLTRASTPADVRRAVAETGWSRFVIADDAGEPVAYLHLKDVLDLTGDADAEPVPAKRMRRLVTIGRDAELEDALARLRRDGVHVARTADAEGRIHGTVFLEDILEELVGEIDDSAHAAV